MRTVILSLAILIFVVFAENETKGGNHTRPEPRPAPEHDDDDWHRGRNLSYSFGPEFISFEALSADVPPNRIRFDLRAPGNSPMRFRLQYFPPKESSTPALDSRVVFESLVEFTRASTHTGVFDGWQEGDVDVQTIPLKGNLWGNISSPIITDITGGGKVYQFTVSYDKYITLDISFATTTFQLGASNYAPGQVKIDVTIKGFPYNASNSYLSLVCAVMGERPFEHIKHENNKTRPERMRIVDSDIAMAFGWNRTVEADGKLVDVFASEFKPFNVPTDDPDVKKGIAAFGHRARFAFGAANPALIVWDPDVGMGSPSDDDQSAATAISAIMALLALARLL